MRSGINSLLSAQFGANANCVVFRFQNILFCFRNGGRLFENGYLIPTAESEVTGWVKKVIRAASLSCWSRAGDISSTMRDRTTRFRHSRVSHPAYRLRKWRGSLRFCHSR